VAGLYTKLTGGPTSNGLLLFRVDLDQAIQKLAAFEQERYTDVLVEAVDVGRGRAR
jgi:hypothetical protein